MSQTVSRFVKGASAPIMGFKSLFSGPKIWLLASVPALVSSGLFIFGLTYGLGHIEVWLALFAPLAEGILGTALNWLVTGLGYVLFIILLVLVVFVLSKIIVVPFNSLIADKVLRYHGVIKNQPVKFSLWVSRSLRMVLVAIIQMFFFVFLGIGLFVLSFVPMLNLLVGYAGFLIVAFDCADYAMETADLNLRQKLALLKRRLPEFSGFSFVLGLTFLVPFLNFLTLPIAVSGASWLVSTFEELWTQKRIS